MKSKEYWERRAAERMVNYQADAERTANEIGRAYYQSQEYIKSEIDKVFRGFQKGFSLSEEEALDILDPSSNKTAMTVLRDAAMKIADPVEREKALAALSSPAYQYRINRLDAINSNIAATCNSLYRTELKADSSFLSSEIVKAYQNTIFDVQKGTGVSGAFDIIPQSKIDAIMSRNWSGTHYSDRIWNNTNKLAGELKSDLMAGFLTGKSEQQMSAEIAERYQTSFFNARRLVRTECTYVTGQAELHSYTEMGVEEYEFSAVLDGDTSKICRSLNGKKFKVSQAKPGVNYPPMHPFCRSVANAVLPSEEELDAMWGDTADAIGADVDFDEWVKNLEKTPDGKWKYQKPLDKSEESGIINYAKAFDHTVDGTPKIYHASPDDVFNELDKSQVGQEAVEYLINNGIKPKFVYDSQRHTNRGMQNGNNIWLYMDNIDSPLIAAQTLVHEVCHHQYGIGQSQWAETVCMAKEKMHKENRTYLTIAEKRKLISLAKKHYGAYQWRRGGQIGGKWV
ncbi:MAG: minor capsid protein [Ruminiclostridium sp.]|nr:minor capsid protein [Ruminiclostridium sp.]